MGEESAERPISALGSVALDAGLTGLGRAGEILGLLLSQVLLARILGPAKFGEYSLTLSLIVFVSTVATLGTPRAALRLIPLASAEPTSGHPGPLSFLRLARVSAVVAAAAVGVMLALLTGRGPINLSPSGVCAAAASSGALAYLQSSTAVARADGRVARAALGIGVHGGPIAVLSLSALLTGLFASGRSLSASSALVLYALAVVGPVAVLCRADARVVGRPTSAATLGLSSTTRAAASFLPLLVISFLPVEIWIGSILFSAEAVALFVASRRLTTAGTTWLQVLNLTIAPRVAALIEAGDTIAAEGMVRRAATIAAIPAGAVLGPCIVAPAWLLETVFGSEYGHAGSLLRLLAIAAVVDVVSGPCGTVLSMAGRERLVARWTFISFAVSACLLVAFSGPLRWLSFGVAVLGAGGLKFSRLVRLAKTEVGIRTTLLASWRPLVRRRADAPDEF